MTHGQDTGGARERTVFTPAFEAVAIGDGLGLVVGELPSTEADGSLDNVRQPQR